QAAARAVAMRATFTTPKRGQTTFFLIYQKRCLTPFLPFACKALPSRRTSSHPNDARRGDANVEHHSPLDRGHARHHDSDGARGLPRLVPPGRRRPAASLVVAEAALVRRPSFSRLQSGRGDDSR